MNPHSPQHQNLNDEIDLVEVVKTLWVYKWTVILTAFSFVALAFMVSFFITPVYQIQGSLKPPMASQVAALDFSELPKYHGTITSFKPNDVFEIFYNNLTSKNSQQIFFNQYYWPAISKNASSSLSRADASKQLSSHLNIRKDPKTGILELTLKGNQPQRLLHWLNEFLSIAEQASKQQIQQNIMSQIALIRDGLQTNIDMKRRLAIDERLDRVTQLEEAIKVAKAVTAGHSTTIVVNQSENKLVTVGEPTAIYFLGPEALQIEMDNLKKRQSDDAFIPGLRQLTSNLGFYQNFLPKLDKVTLYQMDGDVKASGLPVSPNRKMLVLLALVLGTLTGCLLVFIRTRLSLNKEL